MRDTTLIVPGFHGSGPDHWQTWMEQRLPAACRVRGIDWEAPVLAHWAGSVRREIDACPHPVWLVAHSFGCLASVVAAADRPTRVAGALLVAPADPARFGPLGLRGDPADPAGHVGACLPQRPFDFPCVVVASSNDPWIRLTSAAYWADRWGCGFINLGAAGHINIESGFGPWPEGLDLLHRMQQVQHGLPLGAVGSAPGAQRGRDGALARLRHQARSARDFPGRPPQRGPRGTAAP